MQTLGGQILQSSPEGLATIQPGVLTIDQGVIVDLQWGTISQHVDWGGPECLICPGFIDSHLHLPQFDAIGAIGMPLLPWLSKIIFPAEIRWNDPDYAQSMIQRVMAQCVSVGTTGVCAYATSEHSGVMLALDAFAKAGFRGVIGQVLMDQDAPPALLRPAKQSIEETARALDVFPPASRMAAAVTPRFALSCSETLMQQAGKLAQERNAVVQTHLAETLAECNAVAERFDGRRYVDVYHEANLLGKRSVLGHGIHLDSNDQHLLAETESIIAHCPTANAFLNSGMMDWASHDQAQITLALGSDIGAGYERSMVRVARSMIETAMRCNGKPAPENAARAGWHQITAGNADALGWSDAGRIELNSSADLLLIRPRVAWLESRCPLSMLMYAWDDRWIDQTLLRGKRAHS